MPVFDEFDDINGLDDGLGGDRSRPESDELTPAEQLYYDFNDEDPT